MIYCRLYIRLDEHVRRTKKLEKKHNGSCCKAWLLVTVDAVMLPLFDVVMVVILENKCLAIIIAAAAKTNSSTT